MAKWTNYYKLIQPTNIDSTTQVSDNQELGTPNSYGNYNWYHRVIAGSGSRLTRYREWDSMDSDIDISRALDLIAEEITGNCTKHDDPIELNVIDLDYMTSSEVNTVKTALRHWCEIHRWKSKLFKVSRYVVKFGDLYFKKKDSLSKWIFIHPKDVTAAIVNSEDVTDIQAWQVKQNIYDAKNSHGVPTSGISGLQETEIIPVDEIVRFTLNDDMSDEAPFGESVLKPIYKTFKQKELLEDAVIIYRIQRAPERRVFYIDVGKMPPNRVKQYLEQIKNEIRQKKIPTHNGANSEIDSVYNPQCISLDTKIPLLDGRTLKLSNIIEEFENSDKELWAYSVNPETGEIVPGKIDWAGVTRKNTEVIKITLDNGETLTCTPDHMIPVQGKGFVQAQDLTKNDSLLPFIKRDEVLEFNNYNDMIFGLCSANNMYITKIEKIPNIDTGCITIDRDEKYHNYHTFAIESGIFIKNSQSEDYFLAQKCISFNTLIPLLNGTVKSLYEITQDFENGIENWVYSVDKKSGKFIPGKISWAGPTRKNAQIVRVHFDNGEYFDCTPDHRLIKRDGSEVEAQDLLVTDSMMSLYTENVKTNNFNHKVTKIEFLNDTEDTGCLTIEDPGNNHNFAINSGVYVCNSDGRGSKIETLPGGQSVGEISDVEYFSDKMFRGLRIPLSYMKEGDSDGAVFNDGKLGQAYITELRFSLYIERLQGLIEEVLDKEFKSYLRYIGLRIDNTKFNIVLPEPSNFGKYREQEMYAALLSSYSGADAIPYLSKKFIMQKYLQLSHDEIIENERMKLEEMGINPDHHKLEDVTKIYSPDIGGDESFGDESFGDASSMIGSDSMMPDSDIADGVE